MAGFEFTPWGILPIGAGASLGAGTEAAPAVVVRPEPAAPVERITPTYPTGAAPIAASAPARTSTLLDPGKPLTGKQLVAVAKARIRELDRMLKQVPAIEAERAELLRLVDAAKATKPVATVRSLRASGT